MYIAHFKKDDGSPQRLKNHLNEVAMISRKIGQMVNIPTVCFLAGLLHDFGKYTDAFQTYIIAAQQGEDVKRGSVDHSSYGGKLIRSLTAKTEYDMMAMEMIANSIFSHHRSAGLLDFISGEGAAESPFTTRFEKSLEDFDVASDRFFQEIISKQELQILLFQAGNELEYLASIHGKLSRTDQFYLQKMVYSALLDGDRRNTQIFEEGKIYENKDTMSLFSELSQKLEKIFQKFENEEKTPINQLRQQMADASLKAARRETGIYRLSIPTGGGKTLSSMRFALNHALANGKQKIIYIIPFSSIIEQNAEVFRKVLGDQNNQFILEHHSNLVHEEDDESNENERKQALLQDNWDSPIIVTTMVRFLENFFSGSTRNPRRIHQLNNSILIFDEIQSIPPKCLSMFNSLVTFLKEYGKTTTLLCTATQPTLEKRKISLPISPNGEIVPDLDDINEAFERVQVIDRQTSDGWTAEDLSEFARSILDEEKNLLIILNTKKAVREVYQLLRNQGIEVFHLSTSMTANHRTKMLNNIRFALNEGRQIICVTTPLIEAGVDISFSAVIRSISGLDSIAQAAGRCNRNGESNNLQPIYLVNPIKELENIDKMPEIKTKAEVTRQLLLDRKHLEDKSSVLGRKLMNRFFNRYYARVERTGESEYLINGGSQNLYSMMYNNIDRKKFYVASKNQGIPTLMTSSSSTIAKHFKVIENEGESVLVEFDEGEDLISDLLGSELVIFNKHWYQKAQRNSITIYKYQLEKLIQSRLVSLTNAGVYVLHRSAYDEDFGLNMEGGSLSNYTF